MLILNVNAFWCLNIRYKLHDCNAFRLRQYRQKNALKTIFLSNLFISFYRCTYIITTLTHVILILFCSIFAFPIHYIHFYYIDRLLRRHGRITATHNTCTKGTQVDYFLPRNAIEKIWSFWNRHQFSKSPFLSNVWYPAFYVYM